MSKAIAHEYNAIEWKASTTDAVHRSKLSLYGAMATQLLNPYGTSVLQNMTSIEHWNYMKNNGQSFEFQSLGSVLAVRRELGLARAAETLSTTIQALQNPKLARCLDASMLSAAMGEAASLQPLLQILMGCRPTSEPQLTGSPVKKPRLSEDPIPRPSAAEITNAARGFYTWLAEPTSVLRDLINQLDQGGSFYTGNVMAKTCVAWISHGSPPNFSPVSEEDVVKTALTRGTSQSPRSSVVGSTAIETIGDCTDEQDLLHPGDPESVLAYPAKYADKRMEQDHIVDASEDVPLTLAGAAPKETSERGSFAECAATQEESEDDVQAIPTEPSLPTDAQPRSHAADGEEYVTYFDEASDFALLHGSAPEHPSACCVVHPDDKNAGPLHGDDIHKGA